MATVEAQAQWTDGERFVCSATSGHALVADADRTRNSAPSPMELLLIALCSCTATDVVGILAKKRAPFTGLTVRAEGRRADGVPAVYTEIKLIYRVSGPVEPKAMEDAVRLSKEKYCSVSQMLQKSVPITAVIEYAGS
jgi:putative redox protein